MLGTSSAISVAEGSVLGDCLASLVTETATPSARNDGEGSYMPVII